jgi:hypothetical protein
VDWIRGRHSAWLDSAALIVLAAVLIWPLFGLNYLDNWPSIESTFISDARLLDQNLPHPGWQPLWYCGTRFDYIYPPALRYGTAIIAKIADVSTARGYHIYIAIFYVLGIVAVYWLVRGGSGSRGGAWLAACGVALLSPSFLFLTDHRHDSGYWVPQRLHSLMTYGEGPHISALCVLPAALALLFLALGKWRPAALAGAGILCALVVANNFYGATALAIFFPIVTWAVWVGNPKRAVLLRATGIVALSYALCAFWLTPSYLRITVLNLQWVSQPGNYWSRLTALLAICIFCGLTWSWAKRRPERSWAVFVWGAGVFLSLYVLGLFYFGFRVAGEAFRLIPELDVALLLVLVEILRLLWKKPKLRLVAAALALVAFSPSIRYLRHAYSVFPKSGPLENQFDYRIAKWVHDQLPGQRVLPVGSIRFWFDAWFENSQPDGGSQQGILNQILPIAQWQIAAGEKGELATLWLQALGTDAVIVPDRTSEEFYHDFAKPEKFRGLLPVLFDDQHGTTIYRIPRRFPSIGRVVDRAKIAAVGPIRGGGDTETLTRYVNVLDSPDQSLTTVSWKGFDQAEVQAQVAAGQTVLLQETYDPYWRADENGAPLAIHREPVMNFMLIDVPPGSHTIRMHFETPLENRAGQGLFFVGLAAIAALFWRQRSLARQPS